MFVKKNPTSFTLSSSSSTIVSCSLVLGEIVVMGALADSTLEIRYLFGNWSSFGNLVPNMRSRFYMVSIR